MAPQPKTRTNPEVERVLQKKLRSIGRLTGGRGEAQDTDEDMEEEKLR